VPSAAHAHEKRRATSRALSEGAYAAYHWYPRYMSDIDNPSTRFIAVLVLSVIFVLGGQVYESFLFEKRIAAIESVSVIPTEALC
jgi:hypothetical protein